MFEGEDAVFEVAVTGLGVELDGGIESDADLAPFVEGAAGIGSFAALDEVGTHTPAVGCRSRKLILISGRTLGRVSPSR